MKTTINTIRIPTFQPLEVTFVIETQAELDALGTCFNYAPNLDSLKEISDVDWEGLYDRFAEVGADIHLTGVFDMFSRVKK